MTDEEIDAALAQPLPWTAPKTVGDLLTLVFADDWNARKQALELSPGEVFTGSLFLRHEITNSEVVKAHLHRIMEVERKQREGVVKP